MTKKSHEQSAQVTVALLDAQIAAMRLKHAVRHKAQAEYQANWYEQAPLSWLLRKTVIAFDRAVANRLTRQPKEVPVYDQQASVELSEAVTGQEVRALSRSYQQSVGLELVGPGAGAARLFAVLWLIYRIPRKAAKVARRMLTRGRE